MRCEHCPHTVTGPYSDVVMDLHLAVRHVGVPGRARCGCGLPASVTLPDGVRCAACAYQGAVS